jgi:hypothetical protein
VRNSSWTLCTIKSVRQDVTHLIPLSFAQSTKPSVRLNLLDVDDSGEAVFTASSGCDVQARSVDGEKAAPCDISANKQSVRAI